MTRADAALIGTHIYPATGYGGVAESLFNIAQSWARQGHAIRLCASDGSKAGRLTVDAIGLPGRVQISLYRAAIFKRWGFGPGALWRVPAACLGARVVYICGIATWPTTLAALFCALAGTPFVVSVRGGLMPGHVDEIRHAKPHKWLFYKFLTLPSLRRARFIHVTSELERDGVIRLCPTARCEIVANGIDLDAWSWTPRRRASSMVLCFVGRIEKDKGIRRFAEVWLKSRRPGEKLLIAGAGAGDYETKVLALAQKTPEAFEILGYLDRSGVQRTVSRADFLVLPSGIEGDNARENFGNAVAEAMAIGRPAIVTAGLAWDIVEKDSLGFCFDQADSSIAAAIDRARTLSAADYETMSRRCRDYVGRHLSLAATTSRLWQLLSDLAAV